MYFFKGIRKKNRFAIFIRVSKSNFKITKFIYQSTIYDPRIKIYDLYVKSFHPVVYKL